jgi:hypothetical protein
VAAAAAVAVERVQRFLHPVVAVAAAADKSLKLSFYLLQGNF